MSRIGTILELEKNRALVMTGNCDFVFIKRKPDMFVGQQVSYDIEGSGTGNIFIKRILPAASAIAAVFTVILLYFQISGPDVMKNTYAFVDLDINPSIELMIDDSNTVKKAVPLNKDAENILKKSNLTNISLDEAVGEIIDKFKESGSAGSSGDTAVLVSASLNDKSKGYNDRMEVRKQKLSEALARIKYALSKEPALIKVIETTPETRKKASQNGISMGRQLLLEDTAQKGINLTLEEVRESSASDIIKALEENPAVPGSKTQNTAVPVSVVPTSIASNTSTPLATARASSTPARDFKPTSKPTPAEQKVVYDNSVPEVSGKVSGNKIVLKWTPVDGKDFQYYKVVISRQNSKPKYPEDGYLYVISDAKTTSANIEYSSPYNGGDFGEYLTPGQNYYFSVTAVFSDRKSAGNAIRLKYPGGSPSPTPASVSGPKLTASTANNKITLKWTPAKNQGFVYYKVVISENNPNPVYPDDGYWNYYSDINKLQTVIDSEGYNGGDFGGNLVPGRKYYFSITYVYDNSKVTSNVLYLTYPGN